MALWLWLLLGFVIGFNVVVIVLLCLYGARRERRERRWRNDAARLQEWDA